ncbi:MAG: TonB-dependent receptor [candidate division WOR-3 bacterium]
MAMLSIRKTMAITLLDILVLCFAQEVYEIEPLVVIATRYPQNIMEITRTVTIIDSTEIIKHTSLVELLDGIAGIDIKIRGDNIQADPSIRGATFQQVLVMIDGVRVNDPQTGHHNLNIPVPLSEIERIEILKGTASSLYGSDACGGVINIITKKSGQINGRLGIGSFSYHNLGASIGNKSFYIDFENKSSAGYEPGYEYQIHNLFSKVNIPIGRNIKNDFSIGYLNKIFGAKNFYAPYPSWEANKAIFVSLNSQWIVSPNFILNTDLSFRTHIDTFVLDRNNPSFYANHHQTFTYGGQIIGTLDTRRVGIIAIGAELSIDSLNSTRLGQRKQQRTAFFLQIENKLLKDRIILISGIRDDYYRQIENSINPHLSLCYRILPSLKLRTALGSSFRVPSFTELYYRDPANKGDSLLKPESGIEYEFGADLQNKSTSIQITLFNRLTEDDIDWVKKSNETLWQVMNIGKTRFSGLESAVNLNPNPWLRLKTGMCYIYITKDLPGEYVSKYALQIPKINSYLTITTLSILDFNLVWQYYDENDTRFLFNTALNKKFRISKKIGLDSRFIIDNLLDKRYEDFQGVPLPGRELNVMLNILVS